MIVIVGLGNPGAKYEKTRHNVGFRTIDLLSQRLSAPVRTLKWQSLVGEGRIGTEKVLLVKPQTYMNLSGNAVRDILNFYKLEPENLIVVQDDIDIELGTIRVRRKGSPGTHNGLRSIVSSIGSGNFSRVKISVGRRPAYMDLAAFVLSSFDAKEEKAIEEEIEAAADAVLAIVENGAEAAMNRFNSWRAPSIPQETEAEKRARVRAREEQDSFQAVGCGMKKPGSEDKD